MIPWLTTPSPDKLHLIDLESPLFSQKLTRSSSTTATRSGSLAQIPLPRLLTLCLRSSGHEIEYPPSEVKTAIQRRLDPTDRALHFEAKGELASKDNSKLTDDRSWLGWMSKGGNLELESEFMRNVMMKSKNNERTTSIISFPELKVEGSEASVKYRTQWDGIDFKAERAELEKWRALQNQAAFNESLVVIEKREDGEIVEEVVEKIVTRRSQVKSRAASVHADVKPTLSQSSQPSTTRSSKPSPFPWKEPAPKIPSQPFKMASKIGPAPRLPSSTLTIPRSPSSQHTIPTGPKFPHRLPSPLRPNTPQASVMRLVIGSSIQPGGAVASVNIRGTAGIIPESPRLVPSAKTQDTGKPKPTVALPHILAQQILPENTNTLKRKGEDLSRDETPKEVSASKLNARPGGLGVGAGVGPKVTEGRVIKAIPKRFVK